MGFGRRGGLSRSGEPPRGRLARATVPRIAGLERGAVAVELEDGRAMRDAEDAAVDAAGDLLEARDGAECEEPD
jgi:hypothetical protein